MKASEALKLLATLKAAYPREKVADDTLEIYSRDLLDIEIDVAAKAIETLRHGCRFFPSIAEIRRAAAQITVGAPEPMHAFEQALAPGRDRHPVVQRARDIVGDNWMWKTEPPHFHRRPFLEAYAEVLERALLEVAQPALAAATQAAPPVLPAGRSPGVVAVAPQLVAMTPPLPSVDDA